MGTKPTGSTISGYNSSPPSDDGTVAESNKVTWSTTKTKLSDPINTLAAAINTELVAIYANQVIAKSAAYTVTVSEFGTTIEVTGTTTITMGTLAALGAGFWCVILNTGAGIVTIDGAGAETVDGSATLPLAAGETAALQADTAEGDWLVIGNKGMLGANNLSDVASAATSRTNLGVDAAGTDNSTNVSLTGALDYLTLSGQVITRNAIVLTTDVSGVLPLANGGTNATTASGARTALGVDVAGTDNSTNVSLAGTPDYLSISGQIVTRALINLTSHVTGTLPIANGGTAATTASAARTSLGVDAAGTDNSTDVTLAGTGTHRSLTGQALTINKINLTSGTDVSGTLPYANMVFSNNIVAGDIAAGAVGQIEVAASAIGQGEIITSSGAITIGANSSTALAGGVFGFYPQTAANASGYGVKLGLIDDGITTTTYATYVGNLGTNTGKAQQTYVNASPPFNLGHGDIPVFVFALVDNSTKEIKSIYVANVPPWGYNGKTSLVPDYTDKKGNKFKFKRELKKHTFEDVLNGVCSIAEYKAGSTSKVDKSILVPIDHDMKNADMIDIPHPFGGDLTGLTVIALDPLCNNTLFLSNLYLDNSSECLDEITKILHSNHIKINTDSVNAGFSNQVMCCGSILK